MEQSNGEHWFDRLSRPHTRRTALKAAAVAGVALTLPNVRLPRAWATPGEPCFQPCIDAALAKWTSTYEACNTSLTYRLLWASISVNVPNIVIGILESEVVGCGSRGELTWHRDTLACRGTECGDPAKYPGGQKPRPPAPKCDRSRETVCGDICCHIIAECCACKAGFACCAAGSNCTCGPCVR